MNKEIRVYSADCEIRQIEETNEIKVSGYAALFNHESRDLGFIETIEKNAFDGRLEDNVILTFNHDQNLILDRNHGGTLKLSTDDKGLRYDATLPNTSTGKDVAELMRRGLLYESSFAFTIAEDGSEWRKEGDVHKRNITKIERLYDVSIVGVGAYSNTDVALRSLEEFKALENKNSDSDDTHLKNINFKQNELKLKSKF